MGATLMDKIYGRKPVLETIDAGLNIHKAYIMDQKTPIVAKIVGEREVEYGGQRWFLSPLVRKIFEDRNQVNDSGAYQGAAYFCFDGKKLKDLPDVEL